ncbi:MAG: hypothetical protein L3J87_01260 [Thermoplasmata archaeon]|nr:hypothetical protein [Thermoplasmata archaeon]
MNGWGVIAIVAAIVGSVLAILAGPDLATAVPAGMLAVAGAAAFAFLLLGGRADWSADDAELPEGSALSLLVEGFHGNPLGRQAVLGAVVSLERDLPPGTHRSPTLREEQGLLASSPSDFDAWVRSRLDRLELET